MSDFNPGDTLTISARSWKRPRKFTVKAQETAHRTTLRGARGAHRLLLRFSDGWTIHEDDGEKNRGRPCTVDQDGWTVVPVTRPFTIEQPATFDPVGDARGFIERWEATGYGDARLMVTGEHWRLELVTGGWSGNEDMLRSIPLSLRMHWQSSHRGGLHIYGHPAPRENDIRRECSGLADMLCAKNRDYGDSVLDPLRIFSKADSTAGLRVRIDDKLSRLARGNDAGEDTVKDLLGYLVLLRIAEMDT